MDTKWSVRLYKSELVIGFDSVPRVDNYGVGASARLGSAHTHDSANTHHSLRHMAPTHLPRPLPLFIYGPSPRFPLPALYLDLRIVRMLLRPDLTEEL